MVEKRGIQVLRIRSNPFHNKKKVLETSSLKWQQVKQHPVESILPLPGFSNRIVVEQSNRGKSRKSCSPTKKEARLQHCTKRCVCARESTQTITALSFSLAIPPVYLYFLPLSIAHRQTYCILSRSLILLASESRAYLGVAFRVVESRHSHPTADYL